MGKKTNGGMDVGGWYLNNKKLYTEYRSGIPNTSPYHQLNREKKEKKNSRTDPRQVVFCLNGNIVQACEHPCAHKNAIVEFLVFPSAALEYIR